MRRYFFRCCWYLGLILITFGLFNLPFPKVTAAVISALACYIPGSLLWVPLTRLFVKYCGFPKRTFGIETERMGYFVFVVGILMAMIYFFYPSANLASFAALVIFGGVDWVLTTREEKTILTQQVLSNSK